MITAKRQLLSVLILVVISVPALATEPNETKTELKFEISTKVGSKRLMKFAGPVKPKYVAIFSMSDLSNIYVTFDIGIHHPETAKMMLATSAGQSMSEIQKELLKADKVIFTISTRNKNVKYGNLAEYRVKDIEFGLYAFTVEDAELAAEAFVETMTEKAREKLPPLLDEFMNERKQELQVYRKEIADIKNKLTEKKPELKSAESAYKTLKNTDRYRTLADSEAFERARETIAQMNKMLIILDIELSGIREKLEIIEKYRESGKFSTATLEKLEQMFVEQVVELGGAEARKKTALKLRDRDKQFCDFFDAWTGLENEVKSLRNNLNSGEKRVDLCEAIIARPPPWLLPPKVLQNKVTIYPVLAEE